MSAADRIAPRAAGRVRWTRWGALAVAATAAFLVSEIIVRVHVRHVVRTQAAVHRLLEALPGDPRSYRLRAGADAMGYRIDPDGFRAGGQTGSWAEAAARILVIGDSIAFGMGVRDGSATFPALLDRELASSGRVRVLNAGVPGYSSMQEYHHLLVVARQVRPALVILAYCLNDADPVELEEEADALWAAPARLGRTDWSIRSLLNQSFLLRSVKARLLSLSPSVRVRALNARIGEAAWAESREYVARMRDAMAREGVAFLVVVFPWQVQVSRPGVRLAPQEDLAAFFAQRRIDCVDLSRLFEENVRSGLFLPDGVHPTRVGHRLAAGAILAALRERGVPARLEAGR